MTEIVGQVLDGASEQTDGSLVDDLVEFVYHDYNGLV